jgi:hypothetical protein
MHRTKSLLCAVASIASIASIATIATAGAGCSAFTSAVAPSVDAGVGDAERGLYEDANTPVRTDASLAKECSVDAGICDSFERDSLTASIGAFTVTPRALGDGGISNIVMSMPGVAALTGDRFGSFTVGRGNPSTDSYDQASSVVYRTNTPVSTIQVSEWIFLRDEPAAGDYFEILNIAADGDYPKAPRLNVAILDTRIPRLGVTAGGSSVATFSEVVPANQIPIGQWMKIAVTLDLKARTAALVFGTASIESSNFVGEPNAVPLYVDTGIPFCNRPGASTNPSTPQFATFRILMDDVHIETRR